MLGYVQNISLASCQNSDFRRVVYTAKYSQLVLMALKPGEEIGFETHMLDQFFRVEAGVGHVMINGVTSEVYTGYGMIVPAGSNHNVINTGKTDMKLYTIYSPPNHLDGAIHHTHDEATANDAPFDGKTTE